MTWQPDPEDVAEAAQIVVRELDPEYLRSCGLEDRIMETLHEQWKPWQDMTLQQRAATTAHVAHSLDHPGKKPPALTDPPPKPWLARTMGPTVDDADTLITYWELLQQLQIEAVHQSVDKMLDRGAGKPERHDPQARPSDDGWRTVTRTAPLDQLLTAGYTVRLAPAEKSVDASAFSDGELSVTGTGATAGEAIANLARQIPGADR